MIKAEVFVQYLYLKTKLRSYLTSNFSCFDLLGTLVRGTTRKTGIAESKSPRSQQASRCPHRQLGERWPTTAHELGCPPLSTATTTGLGKQI